MMNRDLIRRIQSSSERSTPCKFSLSYNNYLRLSVPACIGFGGRHWQPVCSASSTAQYLGQAVLTRSNPLVCQLVVYRGKAQGRKHYTYSGNVAQGRRSRVCAAREREALVTATSLPVTRTLARQVVRLYRLRMSIEEGFRDMKSHQFGLGLTYHRCASVERLQVLVFIASLALLVLWLVGTATIAQGAHYQFQANSVRHKRILSVLFVGLQMVQDPRIILTRAAIKAAWSALRELPDAQPWAA